MTVPKIVFLTDMAGDVRSPLQRHATVETLCRVFATAKSWADIARSLHSLDVATLSSAAAPNFIRQDLGLPPPTQRQRHLNRRGEATSKQ